YVIQGRDEADPSNVECLLADLDVIAADIDVRVRDRTGHRRKRQLVVIELRGIHIYVVLFGQAAKARHIFDPWHRLELLFEYPVFDLLFLKEVMVRALYDITVDLADRIVG